MTAPSLWSGDAKNNVAEEPKQLAWLVMETLTVLLQGSNTNAGKCVHECLFFIFLMLNWL